ncbi:MAG: hypothetical protein BGO70_09165 [Bacteroidetes bacterium 43-93]|jgi:hypothetical protein|nr:hypothetical protein [Bacteroidota bacterium]OJX00334.1 MAG: hypothetical protein BGO70_09165 [Bacteroidetes bacterium 43-93]
MNIKTLFVCVCLVTANYCFAADTITVDKTQLLYHRINSIQAIKSGLVIYMHGGVSQFKGKQELINLTPEELVEGNAQFLTTLNENGYDLILPIAYNEYNWLENGGEQFISKLLDKYASQYNKVYISGFSDGGTGAFRFFNNHPEKFDGTIIFNGYPQLNNYYRKVDHFKVIGKNIVYASTISDKVIPYEFLLTEFRRQQMVNEHTYFMLREGNHEFGAYKKQDFELCLQLLKKENRNTSTDGKMFIYPPVDGLVIDGILKEIYPFKKKIGKTYNMSELEYAREDIDTDTYAKLLSGNTTINFKPILVTEQEARSSKTLNFNIEINHKESTVSLINWLNTKTW